MKKKEIILTASTGKHISCRQEDMTRKRFYLIFMIFTFLALSACTERLSQQEEKEAEMLRQKTREESEARLRWWRDAKLGVMLHWNPSSLAGIEISWGRDDYGHEKYDQLYKQFKAEEFDATAIVRQLKEAGFRYIGIVPKHHDGFCMWDTPDCDYNIMKTPLKRDVVKELADACHKQGVDFCLYYSIIDWHHPKYNDATFSDEYMAYMKRQIKDLMIQFKPKLLWMDGHWRENWTHQRAAELEKYIRSIDPDIILNNRIDTIPKNTKFDFFADLYGAFYDGPEGYLGDYESREGVLPGNFDNKIAWEPAYQITDGWYWAYQPGHPVRSLKTLIQELVTTFGGDGNLMFMFGMTETGAFADDQAEHLKQMGQWLKKHETAIYNTRGGPFLPGSWGASTYKGKKIYLHVFNAPRSGLVLPEFGATIRSAKLLNGKKVDYRKTREGYIVKTSNWNDINTIIEIEVDKPVDSLNMPIVVKNQEQPDGSILLDMDRVLIHNVNGDNMRTIRYKEGYRLPYVTLAHWNQAASYIEWELLPVKDGRYEVSFNLALSKTDAGSKMELSIGKQKINFSTRDTGGYREHDFKTIKIGEVLLKKHNEVSVTLKVLEKAGTNVMNLQSIILKPY